jgi:hypothetical protein
MGSFFGLADTVAILVAVSAVAGVIGVVEWLGTPPSVAERVGFAIATCVVIPMMLSIGSGIGHLTYVALVATYSWLAT